MVTSPAKAAARTAKRRKKLGVDIAKLVAELQRQPRFEHRLRPGSKLHPRDFPPRALMTGAVHELEHTDDPLLAVEIAMDHLAERKDYYRRLHRAIPNAGANKSDVKIPKEWADELYAWGEFSPASQSLGESAAKGEQVDPIRVRIAVEELRELAKTMQDKRLARMAHTLRGKLENRIFEHELGIAHENPDGGKKKGGSKPPEGTATMKRAKSNGRIAGLPTVDPKPGFWQQIRMGGNTYATYYGSGIYGIAEKKGDDWSGWLIQGEKGQKRISKVVRTKNAMALQGKLGDMAERALERIEGKRLKPARSNEWGEWTSLGPNSFAVSYGQGLHARAEKYADPKHPNRPWHGNLVRSGRRVSERVHASTAPKLELELEQLAQSWLLEYARRGRKRS